LPAGRSFARLTGRFFRRVVSVKLDGQAAFVAFQKNTGSASLEKATGTDILEKTTT